MLPTASPSGFNCGAPEMTRRSPSPTSSLSRGKTFGSARDDRRDPRGGEDQAPDASEADLLVASERFQRDFLDKRPGFIRRELLRLDDRNYLDLVHWRNAADATSVLQRTASLARS